MCIACYTNHKFALREQSPPSIVTIYICLNNSEHEKGRKERERERERENEKRILEIGMNKSTKKKEI